MQCVWYDSEEREQCSVWYDSEDYIPSSSSSACCSDAILSLEREKLQVIFLSPV